jgi:integrase
VQVPQLRHTAALNVADVQPDLRVLQQILEHVSITSTQEDLRHNEAGKNRSALLDADPASVRPGRGA